MGEKDEKIFVGTRGRLDYCCRLESLVTARHVGCCSGTGRIAGAVSCRKEWDRTGMMTCRILLGLRRYPVGTGVVVGDGG